MCNTWILCALCRLLSVITRTCLDLNRLHKGSNAASKETAAIATYVIPDLQSRCPVKLGGLWLLGSMSDDLLTDNGVVNWTSFYGKSSRYNDHFHRLVVVPLLLFRASNELRVTFILVLHLCPWGIEIAVRYLCGLNKGISKNCVNQVWMIRTEKWSLSQMWRAYRE